MNRFLPDLPPLRIVSYSVSTLAGVPAVLARCIAAKTHHHCRCVWAANRSQSGIDFRGDIEWAEHESAAVSELESADVVIVHNGRVDPQHAPLLANKPVITMAHNYPWNVDTHFLLQGFPGIVLGQYQAVLAGFRGWHVVPNPMPLWEEDYQPQPKPETVTICYTPVGGHEAYDTGDSMYWHSKGHAETIEAMRALEQKHGVTLELVDEQPVSHAESLAMKRRSHIVVDECVTGSYHRNSLEGLAAGCLVVNGVGLLEGVTETFQYCAAYSHTVPFEFSESHQVISVLEGLVEAGAGSLNEAGRSNHRWMERHWDFETQWGYHWAPVVRMALDAARS